MITPISASILRECIKHERLAQIVLSSDDVYRFFAFVDSANFETASDAFETIRLLLFTHSALAAAFMADNYDAVFARYRMILESENYVTRRLSLKVRVILRCACWSGGWLTGADAGRFNRCWPRFFSTRRTP